jgi:hypothetical protein
MKTPHLAGRARASVLFVLAAAAPACSRSPPPRPPRQTVVDVPEVRVRVPSAAERIEAALARHERPRAPRVEVTAAPEGVLPRAPKSAALAQAPSKRVIVLHDEWIATRMLGIADPELRRLLESAGLARAFARECFEAASTPETVVVDLDFDGTRATVDLADAKPSRNAACVRKALAERIDANGRMNMRFRVAVRFVPDGELGDGGALAEEESELGRLLARETDAARARELALLLGARRLDMAWLSPATARDAHATTARAAFEDALARAGDDTPARSAALYGLVLAHTMLGTFAEAARAARALACPSRYPSHTAPLTLDQDHPPPWWEAWERVHPTPLSATRPAQRKPPPGGAPGPRTWDEETSYRSPYDRCTAPPAVPVRWVVDAWRSIAAYHAVVDRAAGPFHDNRAATALRLALAAAGTNRDAAGAVPFAVLELGRVLVYQQRYGEAVRVLARIAAPPGDRELLERAAQLVATSLTYVDLEGPGENEPMIERPDVLDVEVNASVAERKIGVVVERASRPELVPQNETFTPLVMHWMAWELGVIGVNRPAVALAEQFLTRYPRHRDAPLVQWEQAETYTMMSNYFRAGAPEAIEPKRLAAEARARLAQYGPGSAWAEANRTDAEALERAVVLARPKP